MLVKMPGARTKILSLFQKNIGKPLSKDTISQEAGIFDWARVIRALRQEGYDIELLKDGSYVMNSVEKKDGNLRGTIDAKMRYSILLRDHSTCQRCGRTAKDGVKLVIDHKIPVELGGETTEDNLWVLCEECNLGKKHWFSNGSVEEMKQLFSEKIGGKRLKMYFQNHPNELIEPAKLAVISGIRDWERTLRMIRQKDGMNIKYVRKDEETGKEGYIYEP